MLTEKQLDQFLDEFWEDSQSEQTEAEQETAEKDLEEYALPSDGMIIRQMEPQSGTIPKSMGQRRSGFVANQGTFVSVSCLQT